MRHGRTSYTLAALVAVGLALAGCSQSPLAPVNAGGTFTPVTPPLVSIAADGTVGYVTAPVGSLTDPGSVNLSGSINNGVTTSATIDGNTGGTLKAGRFTVRIPGGAFKGPATVTISMPDTTVMLCDLSITPQAANKFAKPAQLTADLSSPTMTDASGCTNYWYDPTRATWVNLASKSSCSGTRVTTNLDHFSTYASGKAGW